MKRKQTSKSASGQSLRRLLARSQAQDAALVKQQAKQPQTSVRQLLTLDYAPLEARMVALYVDPAAAATLAIPSGARHPAAGRQQPTNPVGLIDPVREQAAQKEIAAKRKRVAPMYSKGGYQYVGDAPDEIIKGLGRKL